MKGTDQITMTPAPTVEVWPSKQTDSCTLKTVLLHVQNDPRLQARLQAALSLARGTGAHLKCLHVTPIEAYVAMDSLGGVFVMDSLMSQIDKDEEQLRSTIESHLRAEDVA